MLRRHVVKAVFKRNVASYFSGVLGYLFIIVFVLAGSFFAFQPAFFAANQANLDQLTLRYSWLLVFIIPAITMAVWADERKQGTDELLFTLPATDVEILLGKFLAVVGVYTTALLFSLTLSIVIAWLGDPDPWQIATTYLGYWLAGIALIGAGMFASILTTNTTVALVIGTLICFLPVALELFVNLPEWAQRLTIGAQLQYFTLGLVPLSSVLYFLSLAGFMLYLNVVMIGRRHWRSEQAPPVWLDVIVWAIVLVGGILIAAFLPETNWPVIAAGVVATVTLYAAFAVLLGRAPGRHFATRIAALAVALVSINYIAQGAPRIDLTQEKLYTLSDTTHRVLEKVDRTKPVTIQAYLSPQVPDQYADIHRRLIGLLRQIDNKGGAGVDVQINTLEPSSEESALAQQAGIVPRPTQSERGGKITIEDVFLGALIQGPYAEVVVPFFDVGTPIEYELARSIATASNAERATIGILGTDAKVTGGFDMQAFRQLPEWRIVQELKKQYKVEEILPDHPIDEKIDVLIAILPSSLTQPQMEHFLNYIRSGKPTLIFDDPLPVFGRGQGFQLAPLNPRPSPGGGMMGMQQPPAEPKADGGRLTGLMNLLHAAWEKNDPSEPGPAGENFIVFDGFNPHPEFSEVVRPELIFISPKSGTASAFNPDSDVTSGLQELMAWFSGTIRPRQGSPLEFTPLLRTGSKRSGLINWDEIVERQGFFGPQINENPPMRIDGDAHVIAAQIKSKPDAADKVNVIFVADTDIVSDDLFRIQEGQMYGLKIDNVTFVLNAVDSLAGNTDFLALRKRRPKLRTLTEIEKRKDEFQKNLSNQIQDAETQAKERLEKAQKQMNDTVAKIEKDESIDPRTKQQLIRLARQDAQNVLDEETREITRDKTRQIDLMKDETNRQIGAREATAFWLGLLLPPIPAILLMAVVLSVRLMNETTGVSPDRLVKR